MRAVFLVVMMAAAVPARGVVGDLNLDGKLDYQVIRKIIRKGSSEKMTIPDAIQSARIDHLTVFVSNPVIYFTSKYPLFYCLGVDFRRTAEARPSISLQSGVKRNGRITRSKQPRASSRQLRRGQPSVFRHGAL